MEPGLVTQDAEIESCRGWVGREEERRDTVTAAPLAALSALLDRDDPPPRAGDPAPPLAHWLYFLPSYRQSAAGADGHAARGEFLPPVPLPRRMWAGSQFEFHKPLLIGDALTRTSTIADVTEKSGRTGPLVFVKVRHEIRRNDAIRQCDSCQRILYFVVPSAAAQSSQPS